MLDQVLLELALLFALCVGVAVSFHRLRLPPIVGFLVAGVLVGPNGIGLVQHEAMVRELAEVGIVVLLFAVGLEVPLGQLARLKRTILLGGGIQILGTVAVGAAVCWALGLAPQQAVFLGFLLSLSSTAACTKVLVDHGEISAPHGRTVLGISIAQDLAVVPMILLIPLLAISADGGGGTALDALTDLGLLVAVVLAARLLVRPLVALVCRTRSRELFVLFLATWCLGLAVATAHLGLSLALGAFLAGMLLADSEHHGQAAAEIEPFRDAFASLFFVSIGMLFDWRAIAEAPWAVTGSLLAVVVGKALAVMLAVRHLGQPAWVRLRAGLTLAQVGEFSFVLIQLGRRSGLMPPLAERIFVVVAVLSIALTPLLYVLGKRLVQRARGDGGVRSAGGDDLRDHAIVIGFGPTGRTIAAALQQLGLQVVVSEMNAATVKAEKQKGVPIRLGDATRPSVLKSLGIERARVLVLAVNDGAATARIAQLARQLAPQVHVLARAVYNSEADALRRAGASEVVPQELEASIEMLVRVLRRFLVADDEIGRQVRGVRDRAGGGERAAPLSPVETARIAEFVPGIGFQVLRVEPDAACAGKTLAAAGVRRHTGCSVVALRRDGKNLPVITPETVLQPDDTVVVIGPEARLPDAAAMFVPPTTAAPTATPSPNPSAP
ncbi:MAG: cation:proton antiporter [Planctomycetes bacterium]|nr:cation:proton antiporter [Planctomycetota bacterium]